MAALVELSVGTDGAPAYTPFEARQAAALFLRDGIAPVRMTDIAEAAGIGVATLYRRYKTKTALAILAGTYLWQRFNERILEVVESDAFLAMDGAERLMVLFNCYLDAYAAHPDFVRFLDEFDHLVVAESVPEMPEMDSGASTINDTFPCWSVLQPMEKV